MRQNFVELYSRLALGNLTVFALDVCETLKLHDSKKRYIEKKKNTTLKMKSPHCVVIVVDSNKK